MQQSVSTPSRTGRETPPPAEKRVRDSPSTTPPPQATESMRVRARFRPLSAAEQRDDKVCVRFPNRDTVEIPDGGNWNSFRFPSIFGLESTQEQIFELLGAPVVQDVLDGYNGTIFAYGQTGSGKTYTVCGEAEAVRDLEVSRDQPQSLDPKLGIIPRIACELFRKMHQVTDSTEFEVSLTYTEIYRERVRDLVDPAKINLAVREDPFCGCFVVEGATKVYTDCPGDVLKVVAGGAINRVTAATRLNEQSSRSHAVLCFQVKGTNVSRGEVKTGKLFLVDLAGSERAKASQVAGQHMDELRDINLSLTFLSRVIKLLSERSPHISYRDSVLTKLLQDSLGGNSKTTLILCCSPASHCCEETMSTLRFGAQALNIKNRPVVNKELSYDQLKTMISLLQKQNDQLRHGLQSTNADAPAMSMMPPPSTIEMQARLLHLESALRAAEAASTDAAVRAEEAEAEQTATAKLVDSLREEIAAWAAEYSKQCNQANEARLAARAMGGTALSTIQWAASTTRSTQAEVHKVAIALRSLQTTLEDALASAQTNAERKEVENDAVARQTNSLHQQVQGLRELVDILQDDSGELRLKLELNERQMALKNERMANFRAGMELEKKTSIEIQRLRERDNVRYREEMEALSSEVRRWKNMYEALKNQTMERRKEASPPMFGGNVKKVIHAGPQTS